MPRCSKAFSAGMTAVVLLGVLIPAFAGAGPDLIEEMPCGRINWTRGLIVATGVHGPVDKSLNRRMDRAEKMAAAQKAARQNLVAVLKNIRVDSSKTVGSVFANNQTVMSKIQRMAREASVVEHAYPPGGTVEITLEMKINGGFSQLVLPGELKRIESIQTVSPANASSRENGADAGSVSGKIIYTGLLVDARGLEINPTLYPRIYDESGREIYGSAFASREFAVRRGMVRYEKDIESALRLPRIADNPLKVKGLRTTQPGLTDVVVSNADAGKIRACSEHVSFLRQCRVVMIVD